MDVVEKRFGEAMAAPEVEPIPEDSHVPFKPKYILHSWYGLQIKGGKPRELDFTNRMNVFLIGDTDLKEFIRTISRGHPGDTGHKKPKKPNHPHTPLDIPVDEQCYVVVQLDPDVAWSFSHDHPALEQKKNSGHQEGDNARLRHVDPNNSDNHSASIVEGCTICYFEVRQRLDQERREFLCNVRVRNSGSGGSNPYTLEIGIDPDVPNTGEPIPSDKKAHGPS